MPQGQHGPGLVPLRPIVLARLEEDEDASRDLAITTAHRRILDAWHASGSPIHRAGLEVAVKALAGNLG